jgi:ethanolamine kinase
LEHQGQEFDKEKLEALYVEVNQFALFAHLFWGIWALVQASVSDIDFNYMEYAVGFFFLCIIE